MLQSSDTHHRKWTLMARRINNARQNANQKDDLIDTRKFSLLSGKMDLEQIMLTGCGVPFCMENLFKTVH